MDAVREPQEVTAAPASLHTPLRRPVGGIETELPTTFTGADQEALSAFERELYRAFVEQDSRVEVRQMLSSYQQTRADLSQRVGRFGIVNNRIFKYDGCLRVPYLLADTLLLRAVCADTTELVTVLRYPNGTIYTDGLIEEIARAGAIPIDLEHLLFAFEADHATEPRITRIRDIASLLRDVNEASNRNEGLHLLRHLVARLCNLSVKTFLGAKNLQPEVNNLNTQLLRFINGWLCRGLPGLTRTVVRNLSSVIGKPNLIDQLWNDTIRLAEVEVRGSAIVNELRRSSHHALGQRTLLLAQAYLDFLELGDTATLARLGFATPGEADLEARTREEPHKVVARVVEDLGRLLGTSETVARIREWQQSYTENLFQCQFGNSIEAELETLINKGIGARNRWVVFPSRPNSGPEGRGLLADRPHGCHSKSVSHALQDLPARRADVRNRTGRGDGRARLSRLLSTASARPIRTSSSACSSPCSTRTRTVHRSRPSSRARDLRVRLQSMIQTGGFTAQRYFLTTARLPARGDELPRPAARCHAYADAVDLDQCLEIIRTSILNLDFDGLDSRELFDLAGLLSNPERTEDELLDVLRYVSRHYHKIRQRVTVPYVKMSHHLGLEEEDLRTVLANMQRYMHDLNSVVHFSDIAGAFIRERQTRGSTPAPITGERGRRPLLRHDHSHLAP